VEYLTIGSVLIQANGDLYSCTARQIIQTD